MYFIILFFFHKKTKDKDSLNFAENSPNLALSLKESLGLEFFAHYDAFPKFDLTQTVGALK